MCCLLHWDQHRSTELGEVSVGDDFKGVAGDEHHRHHKREEPNKGFTFMVNGTSIGSGKPDFGISVLVLHLATIPGKAPGYEGGMGGSLDKNSTHAIFGP